MMKSVNNSDTWIEKLFLILILLAAAAFRIPAAMNLSLSNDELSALNTAWIEPLSQMIRQGVYIDVHPAGLQVFLHYYVRLIGDDPFIFRLPFVLAGLFSVFLIYIIGKKWFGSYTGLLAAAFFSVFQYAILYSLFARPYSMGLMFSLLSAYAWSHIILNVSESKVRLKWWILFVLSMLACTHIHYFSLVFAASLGILGMFLVKKKEYPFYILSGLIILAGIIPEVKVFYEQLKDGDIGGWLPYPESDFILQFMFNSVNDSHLILILIYFLLIPGLISAFYLKAFGRYHFFALYLFLFSFLLAYLYSILRHPVIQYSTLFFTFPFLLLLVSDMIVLVSRSRLYRSVVMIIVLAAGASSTLDGKGLFTKTHYGVFEDVADKISEWENEKGKENVLVLVNVINPAYMNYYLDRIGGDVNVDFWKVEGPGDLLKLKISLEKSESKYFCVAWSNSKFPPEILNISRHYFPNLSDKKLFFNSAAYLFSKSASSTDAAPLLIRRYNHIHSSWMKIQSDESNNETDSAFTAVNETEFILGYKEKIGSLSLSPFNVFHAVAEFNLPDTTAEVNLVVSIDSLGIPVDYHSFRLEDFNHEPGTWQHIFLSRFIRNEFPEDYELNVYFWNKTAAAFNVRKFEIRLEEADDPYISR
ncbi:MAG: hypothetical protein DWQ44_09980 [Bacteroidetes bacterium]|nr:MAG: hypothetical protein DWQ33_10255 [Bacteroidota bacterium]REK06608.1 MAG: hypothetical protein DWQ39_03770 [Bacteroidota bacterium]REK33374.1 MAG: hypothetical protein DWQ44_09980 [Bacteroidota bacterium]REK49773.1 MAG: hypothetical protein DWQ48_06535 [Bacteroidota bacterium]